MNYDRDTAERHIDATPTLGGSNDGEGKSRDVEDESQSQDSGGREARGPSGSGDEAGRAGVEDSIDSTKPRPARGAVGAFDRPRDRLTPDVINAVGRAVRENPWRTWSDIERVADVRLNATDRAQALRLLGLRLCSSGGG